MRLETAKVCKNRIAAPGYKVLTLLSPKVARGVKPGQFVHILVPGIDSAVLRRPFSIFRASTRHISILYKIVGVGTRAMAKLAAGDDVSILGPLGHGFPQAARRSLPVLVAGGYGAAPLALFQARCKRKGMVFLGAKTARELVAEAEFHRPGWKVIVATEDGSRGARGLVTDALDEWLKKEGQLKHIEFFACGPDGLLKAVAERALAGGWKAWISLDKRMGCGVGACLACVQKIKMPDGTQTSVRVCREGPVLDAATVIWNNGKKDGG